MCLQTLIQQAIAEKEALDARIIKLKQIQSKTAPVKNLLSELLADYKQEAPKDLAAVWNEILAIGQQFNLSVQPLAAEELRQWEADRAELERLKLATEVWRQQLEEAENEISEQDRAWGELSDKRDDLEKELVELRSKLAQMQATPELEYEPEEATDTVENILTSHGFFMPDINLGDCYDQEQKYEDYRGWKIYRSCQDRGIDGIGIYSEEFGFWDASTEMIGDDDPTFPEDFTDGEAILAWTRKVIDEVAAVTPVQITEVPGQLALEFPEPTPEQSEEVLAGEEYDAAVEEELGGNWESDEPTELQKLLAAGKNEFVFEPAETGASGQVFVSIHSEIIPADDTVDFESEEARLDVAIFQGGHQGEYGKDQYFLDAQTFLYHHKTDIRQAALGYAQHFLRELEKKAEIKEKIARWNADETLASHQTTPEPIAEEADSAELANPETDLEFETMGFRVRVYPHYAGEDNLAGATFRFLNSEHVLVFDKSLLVAEIGDRPYKTIAWDLIQDYKDKEAARLEKIANPHKKPEDDFIELVKLKPAVGYLKRKDNGELLAVYIAFANRDAAGQKTETMAKPRAKKWHEYLQSPAFERCVWTVEEPRKVKRMTAKPGDRQQFAYEIKITGKISIEQIQTLAENDFSLLPEEIGKSRPTPSPLPVQSSTGEIYRVKINSYEAAKGTESEMRSRFEDELKILGGSQMSVSLLVGSEVVEKYAVNDFQITQVEDFDFDNPEYEVVHLPSQKSFKVYKRLGTPPEPSGWTNNIYPYSVGFTKREAAAADAVRRLLKAESAE